MWINADMAWKYTYTHMRMYSLTRLLAYLFTHLLTYFIIIKMRPNCCDCSCLGSEARVPNHNTRSWPGEWVRHFGFRPESIKNRSDLKENASTNWFHPWFLSIELEILWNCTTRPMVKNELWLQSQSIFSSLHIRPVIRQKSAQAPPSPEPLSQSS